MTDAPTHKSKMISAEQLAALKPPPVPKIPKPKDEPASDGKQVLETKDYKIEYEIVNGLKQGPLKFTNNQGMLEMQFNYVDDVLDGKGVVYYQNGKVERTIQFSKNKIEGIMQVLYQSGKTWMEIPFKDGKMDGKASFYGPESSLDSTSHYKNNLLNGEQVIYIKNKQIKKYYKDGEETKKEDNTDDDPNH